jgi:hypothetical protein
MIGLLYSVHDVHVPIVLGSLLVAEIYPLCPLYFYIILHIFLILNYCSLVHVMNSILLRSTKA